MLAKLMLVLLAGALYSVQAADNAKAKATAAPPGASRAASPSAHFRTAAPGSGERAKKPKTTGKPTKAPKGSPAPAARAGAAASAKSTPAPKPGKYNCVACTGAGKDCTSTTYDRNVEFCAKITGIVDDPKNVPSAFFSILQFAGLGDVKTLMTQHKGELATIRKGAPPALIALSGQKFNDEGCTDFPSLLGLKDATACLCKGNCPAA